MAGHGEKQYDLKMHSAEHILNQTMVRLFGTGRAFSAHVEKKKTKLDFRFDRPLTDAETSEIERRVNEVIDSDLAVTEEYVSREEAGKQFNLTRLPEDAPDLLRILRIGDYDACPCSGPHVQTTREIGRFRLISTGFENGVLRIRFKLDQPSPQ